MRQNRVVRPGKPGVDDLPPPPAPPETAAPSADGPVDRPAPAQIPVAAAPVDAAVAVGYALAVVYPAAGNLGGWQPLGADQEWTRFDLVTGNFQDVGNCSNGRHEMSSANPFGIPANDIDIIGRSHASDHALRHPVATNNTTKNIN